MTFVSVPTVRSARIGLFQISLAGVLWGTGGLVVQLIRDITPMSVITLSVYRMLIAAAVLGVAVVALRRGGQLAPPRTRPFTSARSSPLVSP